MPARGCLLAQFHRQAEVQEHVVGLGGQELLEFFPSGHQRISCKTGGPFPKKHRWIASS
jgi:hypothetical protein